ncbi:hypothetical protein TNCV_3588791 [Trichonephila clavipes]|nr:hypothetical protein TNCV_3588791 [Trichonephila clavipes]
MNFPCCQFSCHTPKWEKTIHRVNLVPDHVTTLKENLRCRVSTILVPNILYRILGLEIKLAIPFSPIRDPQDSSQQA